MRDDITVKELAEQVDSASTNFEKTNTELKRKYLLWNIEAFNIIASKVKGSNGTFGTGYPFYALDEKLEGTLPIIEEQIRYNRQLVKDGLPVQTSIWKCKSCLKEEYDKMPDLKQICKPCPNMIDELKPRRIIGRLPDIDMWIICKDGMVESVQKQMSSLLESINMCSSDIDPIETIRKVENISSLLKDGKIPTTFLPIDAHIIEYSTIKGLIEQVPDELDKAKRNGTVPYLPILPKSYRKKWQYDDEAYNFIYDYLSAFTLFSCPKELQQSLNTTRARISLRYTPEELFNFLLIAATKPNFRRFQSSELENCFMKKIMGWKKLRTDKRELEEIDR